MDFIPSYLRLQALALSGFVEVDLPNFPESAAPCLLELAKLTAH